MPTFKFTCKVCGEQIEKYDPLANQSDEPVCGECEKKACRTKMSAPVGSKESSVFGFRVGNREYASPIISQSLAINPEQAAEHRAAFPDVALKDDQFPVFENYQQHEAYLEKSGFVKQRNRRTRTRTKYGIARTRVTMGDVRRRLETEQGNAESALPPEKE